ncbi:MAG: ATPase [Flavobacteriales bacterium CG_4_9_14_3_um_filter_32_8]|nr:MAG: ATPase [Flavobacteriales bacterium CG_4_9_14_3_um_filter_32_8]
MIQRIIEHQIQEKLFQGKIITLIGARQTGKTTLLKKLMENQQNPTIWLNADEFDIKERFKNPTSTALKSLIGNNKLVMIDEAQNIDEIGLALKLLIDTYPEIQVIATGSSAFELQNKMNEPLTGRKFEFQLYPFSYTELANHTSELIEKRMLKHRLVFGSYPEVVNNLGNEIEVLKLLSDSYLYRDLLMLDAIKKPEKLIKLLQALAYQLGNVVSYNEIGNLIGIDSKTVESYIQLLEKSFVVFRLPSFSRNLRNELKASKKIYFYDNGIRNALISSFQILEGRQDIGALWENYLVSEHLKRNNYAKFYGNTYFWRTKDKQEIDYVEEKDGKLSAYEFKWTDKKKHQITKTFTNAYPESKTAIIHSDNYEKFISQDVLR